MRRKRKKSKHWRLPSGRYACLASMEKFHYTTPTHTENVDKVTCNGCKSSMEMFKDNPKIVDVRIVSGCDESVLIYVDKDLQLIFPNVISLCCVNMRPIYKERVELKKSRG